MELYSFSVNDILFSENNHLYFKKFIVIQINIQIWNFLLFYFCLILIIFQKVEMINCDMTTLIMKPENICITTW